MEVSVIENTLAYNVTVSITLVKSVTALAVTVFTYFVGQASKIFRTGFEPMTTSTHLQKWPMSFETGAVDGWRLHQTGFLGQKYFSVFEAKFKEHFETIGQHDTSENGPKVQEGWVPWLRLNPGNSIRVVKTGAMFMSAMQ